MKDQYFGDRTDYIKHSLLRVLSCAGIRLAVHWNKTADDTSSDGGKLGYLREAALWRSFDPEIFDEIRNAIESDRRDLHHFEEFGFIRDAHFCYDEWRPNNKDRMASLNRFVEKLTGPHLFFFDPDNGIEVSSSSANSKNSNKYVFYEELKFVWELGHDLMIYQHFPRVSRRTYLENRFAELVENLPKANSVYALSTSFAAFIFVQQGKSCYDLDRPLQLFSERWSPHASLFSQQGSSPMSVHGLDRHTRESQLNLPI